MNTKEIFSKAFENMTKEEVIEILAENYDSIVQTIPEKIIELDEHYLKGIKDAYKSGDISLQEAVYEIEDNFAQNKATIEWMNEQIMKELGKTYIRDLVEKWLKK